MATTELMNEERVVEAVDVEFDKEKFKQILHYIIHKCGHLENVGKTVLFKLLYFTDFDFYELTEEKLTGEAYLKADYGPLPIHFSSMIEELQNEEKVEQCDVDVGKYVQHKFISLKEPKPDLLRGDVMQFVETEIAKCGQLNASQIAAFSHKDMPYKATEDDEIIDYELVFYRDSMFSVREYEDD